MGKSCPFRLEIRIGSTFIYIYMYIYMPPTYPATWYLVVFINNPSHPIPAKIPINWLSVKHLVSQPQLYTTYLMYTFPLPTPGLLVSLLVTGPLSIPAYRSRVFESRQCKSSPTPTFHLQRATRLRSMKQVPSIDITLLFIYQSGTRR
ncbi:hypothetical protein F5X96DRAFT_36478 [Biscogniauxia mediterranea]|nr:hypothetical protein F5X96DRAFT_36478 [Biscogniauxia mediterranea]